MISNDNKENKHSLSCDKGTAMVAHYHRENEEENTHHTGAPVLLNGKAMAVDTESAQRSADVSELDGVRYVCSSDKTMVSRQHFDKERGKAFYKSTREINPTSVNKSRLSQQPRHKVKYEYYSDFTCRESEVMHGFYHWSNVREPTEYRCTRLWQQ